MGDKRGGKPDTAVLLVGLECHVPCEGSVASSLGQEASVGVSSSGVWGCAALTFLIASLQQGATSDMQGLSSPWEILQKGRQTLVRGFSR